MKALLYDAEDLTAPFGVIGDTGNELLSKVVVEIFHAAMRATERAAPSGGNP